MNENDVFLQIYDQLLKSMGQGVTAGRIVGLLMIGQNEEMTLDQLAEQTGRSKSTVHTAIKTLLSLGLVLERIDDEIPSEGRYPHFYSFRKDFFELSLQQYEQITVFKKMLQDAIKSLKKKNQLDSRIEAFEKTYALYGFYEEKLQEILTEWKLLEKNGQYRKYITDLN